MNVVLLSKPLKKKQKKTFRRASRFITLMLSRMFCRLQMFLGQNDSDNCSCVPTSAVALLGVASRYCSSSQGPVASRLTSRLNRAKLVSRK